MNCNQARTMMSAYRELKSGTVDTTELDAHLETCAACRETLASYTQIGEQLHFAPLLTPPPDAHERLMKALADEQLQFLQKSAPGKVSTPEFLKPYLQERAQETQADDEIAAFSTAETGPLPIIHARRKPRKAVVQKVQVRQFAVLGLAAAVLILLMTGGLTSLFMLAHSSPTTAFITNNASLNRPTEVNQKVYTTDTLYSNVTSALANGNYIYYAASGIGDNANSWQLMQFDRSTQVSKPLLAVPSPDPLIVLAASDTWLVWLEFDRPQFVAHGAVPGPEGRYAPDRAWTLSYLSLLPQSQAQDSTATNGATATPTPTATESTPTVTPTSTPDKGKLGVDGQPPSAVQPEQPDVPTSVLLSQGIFDSAMAPDWVNSPIQGTWLNGDTLLVTSIDQQGVSYLTSYNLGQTSTDAADVVIARALAGHVLAWPSTDTSGLDLYWADEWVSTDTVLHSNIWERLTSEQTTNYHGFPYIQSSYTQKVLMNDGMSFQPQVVNETLFFVSTSEVVISGEGATQQPNGTPFPISATDRSLSSTPRTNPAIYTAPTDASVHGTVFLIPLDGPGVGNETMLGTVGQSTGFQAGGNYVIWQDNTGYRMYDTTRQGEVMLGNTLTNASLLAVNGNTTVWLADNSTDASGGTLTLMVYNWPD